MPDGFTWAPRCHLDTLPTGLFLFGEEVASLIERLDGSWFAYLRISGELFADPITRDCTSFEAGQRGCELWALRHELMLRERVAAKVQWMQNNVVAGGRGRTVDVSRILGLEPWRPGPTLETDMAASPDR